MKMLKRLLPFGCGSSDRFRLHSGERQTAAALSDIRADHTIRYRFVADMVKTVLSDPSSQFGLDVFCGVGYGTYILQTTLGCRMLGIEGSAEAVTFANAHYSTYQTFYVNKIFPFSLPRDAFDFIVSLESLEHLPEYQRMLEMLGSALKTGGLLVLSTPNEEILPFQRYQADFSDHHIRHFTTAEIASLAATAGLSTESIHGQDMYELGNDRVVKLLEASDMEVRSGEGQINLYCLRKKDR